MSFRIRAALVVMICLLVFPFVPVLPTGASPFAHKIVCLDAGHGGNEPGAINNNVDGAVVKEKDINLAITLKARDLLSQYGCQIVMTRETDIDVSLQKRCDIANEARASIFVSIHNNAATGAGKGTETYYYTDSVQGKKLATSIQKQVLSRIKRPNRGVMPAEYYVLKNTNMTAALHEGAFISDPDEVRMLLQPEFQQKIAEGLVAGIVEHLELDPSCFHEYLLLSNPDVDNDSNVHITYLTTKGELLEEDRVVPAGSRQTVDVNKVMAGQDLSIRVESTNGVPLVAERAMYFGYSQGTGGHSTPGSMIKANAWYLAEGCTDYGFNTYVCMQNPNPENCTVNLKFMCDDGYVKNMEYPLLANSRYTVNCADVKGIEAADFSVQVNSTKPIIVERAMYFANHKGISGGHCSGALTSPSNTWYLAEGYTGKGFETWLLIQNPSEVDANATVSYLLPGGAVVQQAYAVAAESRKTILVNQVKGLEDTDVSFKIDSDQPVIVERSQYFTYLKRIDDGSNSTGVTASSRTWFFAEGYTGEGFDTYLLLMNPNDNAATATIYYYLENGDMVAQEVPLLANARHTVTVNNVPGMSGQSFGIKVASDLPIVAERSKYYVYNGWAGGDAALGVTSISPVWYFAEGCTK